MTKDNIIKAIKEGNFDRILLETAKNNFEAGKQNTLKQVRQIIGKKMGEIMSIPCDTPEKAKFQTAFVNWLDNLTKSLGGDKNE